MNTKAAAESLDRFLRENIQTLRKSTLDYMSLRHVWLQNHPEYKEEEFYLDLEWTGLHRSERCYPGGMYREHAKDFKINILDEDHYRWYNRVYEESIKRSKKHKKAFQEMVASS